MPQWKPVPEGLEEFWHKQLMVKYDPQLFRYSEDVCVLSSCVSKKDC